MADYSLVHIKRLGKPKLARLMKGGAIRIEKPSSVEDAIQMFLMPKHTAAINKKFSLGKLHQIRLSPDEIQRNMMEGGSLYESAQKYGKIGLKYAAPVLKQVSRAGITAGSAALAAAQPELIPFIPFGAAALGSASDNVFDSLANMETDDAGEGAFSPENVNAFVNNPATKYARQEAMKTPQYQRAVHNTSKYVPVAYQEHLSKYDAGSGNDGYGERAGYGHLGSNLHSVSNQVKAASHRQRPSLEQAQHLAEQYQMGRGLYASNMRGYGLYSGSGMHSKTSSVLSQGLLGHYSMVPQPLVSQPMGINLASKAFQPVALQSFIQ
jgi:hypothetical protein